jgi:hypothetical protein
VASWRSLQFTALGSLAYADVPAPLMSNASSHASMAQQLFLSLCVAIAALLLHLSLGGRPAASLTSHDFTLPFERRLISRPETSSGAMDSAIETVLREYKQRAEGEMKKMLEIGPADRRLPVAGRTRHRSVDEHPHQGRDVAHHPRDRNLLRLLDRERLTRCRSRLSNETKHVPHYALPPFWHCLSFSL